MRRILDVILPVAVAVYGMYVLHTSHAVPPYGKSAGSALFALLAVIAIHEARLVHGGAGR